MIGPLLAVVAGCHVSPSPHAYVDDPAAYRDDDAYRRNVLEADLTTYDNTYAERRLERLEAWGDLPTFDPRTTALTSAQVEALGADQPLVFDVLAASTLTPTTFPTTDEEWEVLGRRVFFEYPLRSDSGLEQVLRSPDGPASVGFLLEDDVWVGLRVFQTPQGDVRVGPTCAQCHAGRGPDGAVTGARSNRAMNIGGIRLLTLQEAGTELDTTDVADLENLGPGRADVLGDGVFNPYAFPDFAGLGDLPFLHHNANWLQRTPSTLALRCETLFITSSGEQHRIPRVLSYALARWMQSLAPLPPQALPSDLSIAGEAVFEQAGCSGCHVPPLFTSAREVSVAEVGTEPSAGESPVRRSGNYRIPSLRGVAWTAPYLHHGAVSSLEDLFEPTRDEPGHPWGLALEPADRTALVAYLRTL
jgi:mono/diheme cytochrome c family protein